MFIKKIKIKNFKTLKDFEIEPKPLTLLFGANSSGKSNFIRAMLFFKKNVLPLEENRKDYRNGQLSYKLNENVDLISFDEIVSDGDTSQKISYEFFLNFDYWFPKDISEPVFWKTYSDFDVIFNDKNGIALKSNISVYFEFVKGSGKDYLSKILFNDLDKNFLIEFNIQENDSDVIINCSDSNINLSKIFNIYKRGESENELCWYNNIPFFKIGSKDFIKKLEEIKNNLKSKLQLTDDMINKKDSLKDSYKLDDAEQLRIYYLYSTLIPSLFQSFFSAIHFPQLREIPDKTYILENNNFEKNVYYNLLDSFYRHQDSLIKVFLKLRSKKNVRDNEKFKLFSKNIKLINEIREKLSDKEIIDLFSHFEFFSSSVYNFKTFEEIIKQNKKSIIKEKKHWPVITKFDSECNKTEKILLFELYENNDSVFGVRSYDYDPRLPSFIRNIFLNTNKMIFNLGFDGILYLSKEKDFARLILIKNNNISLNIVNESSGFLQILPILIGISNLKESYDFDVLLNNAFVFQDSYRELDSFDISKEFSYSLYIEQPELHLHPKLQSEFANILISEIKSFNIHNSIFMETHSEHILKKVQIGIAKGIITQNDVGVYFFTKKNGTAKANKICFNEFGQLEKDFPDGFFDDSLNLTFEYQDALKQNFEK